MKKILLILAILPFTIASAISIEEELHNKISIFQTMAGDFTQIIYDEMSNIVEKSRGNAYIKKPSSIYWETNMPSKQTMIKNENTLWIYDVDLEQVTVQDVKAITQFNVLSLLLDENFKYSKYFDLEAYTRNGSRYFVMTSSTEDFSFMKLIIGFSATNKLSQISIFDYTDSKIVIEFDNVLYNKDINDDKFIFIPPEGVDVIKH